MELSRRDVMKYGMLGSAALLLPIERVARTKLPLASQMPASGLPKPFELPWQTPPVAQGTTIGNTDVYEMHMKMVDANILGNGRPTTRIFGYEGVTPGPTIRVKRGRRVAIRHCNTLPELHPDPAQNYPLTTSVHLHGSASLPQYDGYASDTTAPGSWKDYHYPNFQDARTLWYHDHGIHHTANNAYMGLAAQYHIIDDEVDNALGLPTGKYDLPMVVRDGMFDTKGQLIYSDNSESGIYGDVNLVNGVPWPTMQVEPRKYRFRILNASISRSYKWRMSNGMPFAVIATDGGLMKNPQIVKSFRHGMAERYEVILDFSAYAGKTIQMLNDSTPNNIDYANTGKVMQFVVANTPAAPSTPLYTEAIDPVSHKPLYNDEVWNLDPNAPGVVKRNFKFERKNGHWTVNGETWENVIESGYEHASANPKVGATEIWTLENSSGGWFHPVHIHLIDFKILSRTGGVKAGTPDGVYPHERGPKDVVYVGEGEKVSVIMKFDDTRARERDALENPSDPLAPRRGRYMMHCHNLVHEDHDMMVQFWVGADEDDKGPAPWSPHGDDVSLIEKGKDAMPDDPATLGPDAC